MQKLFQRKPGEPLVIDDAFKVEVVNCDCESDIVTLRVTTSNRSAMARIERKSRDLCAHNRRRFEDFCAFHESAPDVLKQFVSAARDRLKRLRNPKPKESMSELEQALTNVVPRCSRLSALSVLQEVRTNRKREIGRGVLPLRNEFAALYARLAVMAAPELEHAFEFRTTWYDVADDELKCLLKLC